MPGSIVDYTDMALSTSSSRFSLPGINTSNRNSISSSSACHNSIRISNFSTAGIPLQRHTHHTSVGLLSGKQGDVLRPPDESEDLSVLRRNALLSVPLTAMTIRASNIKVVPDESADCTNSSTAACCPVYDIESFRPREMELLQLASNLGLTRSVRSSSTSGSSTAGTGAASSVLSSLIVAKRSHLTASVDHQTAAAAGGLTSKISMSMIKNTTISTAAAAQYRVPLAAASSPLLPLLGISMSEVLRISRITPSHWTTADVAVRTIKQKTFNQDNRSCRRYVDLLDPHLVRSRCDAYIVHTSAMSFKTLTNTLSKYFERCRLDLDDVFVWIDVFCSEVGTGVDASCDKGNTSLNKKGSGSALLQVNSNAISAADKVLLVVDPEGTAFTRTYVLYELWVASRLEKQNHIVVLPTGWDWSRLIHPFLTMDLERSDAYSQELRIQMLKDMRRHKEPVISLIKDGKLHFSN
ncbi:hypothetical protein CEUSTIGMA_g8122.t1 [Chlamydomonas eustigma]|uniref:Uncharacterized protein n=1 Tax=Chlamydomonas eustigma TaxID=1157962 RepID=A0A250XC65_9CHLO|nr:hypothetical protein CEUSTIGMA_g8122.t1 [Chlamydomonas eustigma]|eukprot:GAX80687.1 hypothetical protein CEUSTIGMA_g8122.t1 [Chlamydomonas eustigma]